MNKRTFNEMLSGSKSTSLPTACLLESGRWSDLTIKCQGREWKVHRVIVGIQSKPLAAAMSGEFEEAKTGIIKLDDHDPEIVDHMINFMYSGDYTISYPDLNKTEESEACLDEDVESETTGSHVGESDTSQELLVHTAVYQIAEEKDILTLKQLAKKKYEAALPNGWNSMAFCDSLRIIYDETPENDHLLWDVAISFAGKKAKELMDRGEFVELWKEKGEIGLAVFRAHLLSKGCQNNTPNTAPLNPSSIFGNTTTRARTCPTGGTAHSAYVKIGRRTSWCGVPYVGKLSINTNWWPTFWMVPCR